MESSICRHPVISTAEPRHALDCWPASTPTAHRCQAACNVTCHMLDSIPQPDVFLRIDPSYGWQSRDQGEYPAGAPELIVEVCPTSTEVDFGPELALYIRACVREYGTIELLRKRIAWRRCRQAWTQMSTGCPRHPSQQNASRAGYEKNNILPHRRPTRDARYKMKKSCAGMLSHLRHTYR